MMITVGVLICLITLTSQLVHSKMIMINITSGNSSPQCCTEEGCMCASLTVALQYINSSTTINITSSSIMLEDSVKLGSNHTSGSGNLTDITITGSNVTIMCNYSGSVYCESCDDVIIKGITWDSCGDLNGTNIAGVTFNGTSNISLVNCTFQHSLISAVTLLNVFENVNVHHCKFLSNSFLPNGNCNDVLHIVSKVSEQIYLNISDSYFYDNDHILPCGSSASHALGVEGIAVWHVAITKTTFFSNKNVVIMGFLIQGDLSVQLTLVDIENNYMYNVNLFEFKSGFYHTPVLLDNNQLDKAEILIINSTFTNNGGSIVLAPSTSKVLITLVDVEISHNVAGIDGILTISFLDLIPTTFYNYEAMVNFTRINVMSNSKHLWNYGPKREVVSILFRASNQNKSVIFEECDFFNNTSASNHGVLHVSNDDDTTLYTTVTILNSKIQHNHGDSNVIIYLSGTEVIVNSSNFTDNVGSSIHLVNCYLSFKSAIIFANNTADNGGALYIEPGSRISFDTANVQFTNNSATEYGGAMYIDLFYDCPDAPIDVYIDYVVVSFVNNTAAISGNSLYFYIPTHCELETNISDSILYASCQFDYSQPVNGKMMNIPCDIDYTLLNGTGAPIVTSPHELRLYFPFSDGYNTSSNYSDHNLLH